MLRLSGLDLIIDNHELSIVKIKSLYILNRQKFVWGGGINKI